MYVLETPRKAKRAVRLLTGRRSYGSEESATDPNGRSVFDIYGET
jgi:hypothetical protein